MPLLSKFFSTAAGLLVRRWEAAQMDALLAECSGDNALQLGAPYGSLLRNAPHESRILAVQRSFPDNVGECAKLRLNYENLPFREASFDLVVCAHASEWVTDSGQFFNEIFRVLAPEGRLIVLSFNPWGPWCVRKKDKLINLSADIHFKPLSVAEVKSQCQPHAIVDRGRFGVYCPSLSDNPQKLARWGWCEKAGDRWWPALSNVYMLSAIKKEEKPSLIGKLMPQGAMLKKGWGGQTVATRNQVQQ